MFPASQPAIMPTMMMTMRLSFDRCMRTPLRVCPGTLCGIA
jgi:hypothetical protein